MEVVPESAREREGVRQFRDLRRIVLYGNNDTPTVRCATEKARQTWGQFRKVLEKENALPCKAGVFYQAVVASVMLYGSESWVVSLSVMRELEGFTSRPRGSSLSCVPERSRGSGFIPTLRMFWRRHPPTNRLLHPGAPSHRPQHNPGP